jgi:ABC-type transporter Mla MlaB component
MNWASQIGPSVQHTKTLDVLVRGKEVRLPTQPARSGIVVVTIGGPVTPGHVDGACAELRGVLIARDPERVVCDVAQVRRPDAATVDLLARLALIARRQGRQMALAGVPFELSDLLAFLGLGEIPGLGRDPQWLPERGEDALDVEEEGDPGDPVA